MTPHGEALAAAPNRPIRASRRGGIGLIELNRPTAHNALDDTLLETLAREIQAMSEDPSIRALILTGAGSSFCSGDDLKAAAGATKDQFARTIQLLQALTVTLLDAPKPVIAALNGPAFGAGLELALNCDVRIATHRFECATPEARLGLTPTNAASVLLPLLIGSARARRMLFGGGRFDAHWCLAAGLVDELTAPEALLARAIAVAQELSSGTAGALTATRQLLNAPLKEAIVTALQLETALCLECHQAEGRDRVRAFLSARTEQRLAPRREGA